MTQPQLQVCVSCGSVRLPVPANTVGLLSVAGQPTPLLPCPVCTTAAVVAEMVQHVKAIEGEMVPTIEPAEGLPA